jgi:hypothetical protein
MIVKLYVLFAMTMLPITAYAGTHHHDKHTHSQKAHVHGISQIKLAIGESSIEIQFVSPANNIVGFEHIAKTNEEKTQVQHAKAILLKSNSLFRFHGTYCQPESSVVNVHALLESQASHKEVSAQYRFSCDSTELLNNIEFKLFEHFPIISKIDVQWISETNQGMSILSPSKNRHVVGD